jgi:hypothetical protein
MVALKHQHVTFALIATAAFVPVGGSPGKNLASGASGSWFGGKVLYMAVLAMTCDIEGCRLSIFHSHSATQPAD